MALDPRSRSAGLVLFFGGSGFLLSAAGLTGCPQPLAMGMICATTGWRALVMSLGAMAGYPVFWGSIGNPGIVWSAAGGLLALLLGKREEARQQPLMIPAIAAFLTAVLRGYGPADCTALAAAEGACCVTAYDALGDIRPIEELMERIRAGWPLLNQEG